MTQLASETKQSKLCELNNLIAQYNNGETENINSDEYPLWVEIVGMLKTNDIDDSIYDDFLVNPDHYKVVDDEIVYNSDWEEEAAEAEAERIANLTMTPLDFINFLVDSGLTLEQINTYLEANLSVKMQLTYCNNVYCSVAKALMPITIDDITITADMVEEAFVEKNA